ncbi:uncharacterized protein LOC119381637 [Rhipicephalus sanguineus]|uniref:uncharacterized protein LOC119381637 n=1 Tax=Rhipicephalus sanguineus TaxID=34632 RepID=UPI0018956C2F|nr:uncharacterized protein LOC119381637 [Rhipicephalus sanguineus]
MRCVDFLCYCPLPFELRGNGDCLAPKPNLGKLIAAVTPTTLLFIVVAGIGGAFIFRRLFPGDDKKTPTAIASRRPDQKYMTSSYTARSKVPTTSISVRSGPLKSLRPKKPNSTASNNRTNAPSPTFPSTRLLRVPPDQLRPDAFSPGPTSTTTAMRMSSFTPPVPFAKSSQMLDKSSARSTAQPQPSRLSTTQLMNKILSSSADSSDEDNIVVRVFEDYTSASQSKSSRSPQRTSLPFTAAVMQPREVLPFRNSDGSSLPIEWGTSSDRDRQGSLAVTTGGKQGVSKKGLEDDDPSGKLLFSSFRQSKNVTFLDDVSPVSGAGRLQMDEGETPGQLTAKRSMTFPEQDRSMKTGSLKAETRWLCQNGLVPDTAADGTSSGHQRPRKSEPAYPEEAHTTAGVKSDEGDNRVEHRRGQLLSRGERNRLGLGTPFVGPEEGSLAESASIPLSFLSSCSPSFEVLPKPDIGVGLFSEALLQSAEENEVSADAISQEKQDASLVADFMAAIMHGESSSDGAAATAPSGATVPRDINDVDEVPAGAAKKEVEGTRVAAALRVPSSEQKVVQPPRLSSPSVGEHVASAAVKQAPRGS